MLTIIIIMVLISISAPVYLVILISWCVDTVSAILIWDNYGSKRYLFAETSDNPAILVLFPFLSIIWVMVLIFVLVRIGVIT